MRHSKPTVSVIVPAYNVEGFLDQALESAERQSLDDIEIICVNDGSTDATLAIANEHAARDARIHVIDKQNGGYGSACNRGISEARGEWVAILEPDDWIEAGMYADMVAFADSLACGAGDNAAIDIVKTPYWRIVDPDTPAERRLNCSYKGRIRPAHQPFTMQDEHVDHLLIHHPSIWSALYRRSFLEEFGIRFREIPGAGWADNPFSVETLCQARAIAYLDRTYYCYREETADKAKSFAERNADVPFERWHDIMDVLERIGERNPDVLRAVFRRGFTYLDYIGEGIELDDPRVHAIMARMFARMDDDLVLSEPNIPPVWKRRYQDVKGIPRDRISPLPYAASLVKAGVYSLKNVGAAEALSLVGSVMRRDNAAKAAGSTTEAASLAAGRANPAAKLSVIVPIYNAQRYLDECLRSVEGQTYGNLEVLCIDDGSTDRSREILERHAQDDSRIRIIGKRNGGPSSARNAGIEAATGDFVCFLDCDDMLEPDACRRIAEAIAADEPDAISFGWSCFPAGQANRWLAERTCVRDAVYDRFEPALLFDEMTNPYLRTAVRTGLLRESGIRFDEELRVGEDCAFLFSLFPRTKKTRLVSDRLYRYRMPHEGSIMSQSQEGSPGKCLDDLRMAISVFGDWGRSGFLELYGAQLMHWFITLQLYTLLRQPTPLRDSFIALVKQLWRAHFTDEDVRSLDMPAHDHKLAEVVLCARDDGTLPMSERALATTMLSWRIAEYGVADLARTAVTALRPAHL